MIVVWSRLAIADLDQLRAFIAEDSPYAAQRMALRIVDAIETNLPDDPHLGRPGRVPGTRELVIRNTPFIAPYRVVGKTIQVLRIYHAARRWPERF